MDNNSERYAAEVGEMTENKIIRQVREIYPDALLYRFSYDLVDILVPPLESLYCVMTGAVSDLELRMNINDREHEKKKTPKFLCRTKYESPCFPKPISRWCVDPYSAWNDVWTSIQAQCLINFQR